MAQAETEKLIEMTFGAVLSRAICTVAELGVADQITPGSPKAVEALAAATGTHERALYRMLRFLASHGIFREEGVRHFDHTRLSECLRSGVQGSYRSAAQMLHRVYAGWDGLHHAVLTGDSGFNKVFGRPLFDYIGANPDLAPIFDAGMTAIHGHETAAMLEAYDFSAVQVLADIGGGNGSLITAVLQRYPRLKGILFELDHVAERTQENFKRSGIQERCSILRGNFFDSVPSGADAYFLRHIIHDWTDEQSVQILPNCRKVMTSNGRLLIVEAIVPGGNESSLAKLFDIIMLVFSWGPRTN